VHRDGSPAGRRRLRQRRAAGSLGRRAGRVLGREADRFDRVVARYDAPFLAAAALRADDRVLDVGCGTGRTTRDAARRARSALGVDLSAAMLEVARRRAADEGLGQRPLRAGRRPGGRLPTGRLRRRDEPDRRDVLRRPGGRAGQRRPGAGAGAALVLLVWQAAEANEWITEITAARGRRAVPLPCRRRAHPARSRCRPARIREVLTAAGHRQVEVEGLTEPEWWGADPDDALTFVLGLAGGMLDGLDPADRDRAVATCGAGSRTTPVPTASRWAPRPGW
jgi:SAM-dependent methyltransferase